MKYMLLIYGNPGVWDAWSADEFDAIMRAHAELQKELKESGEYVESQGLTTIGAKTVRVGGEVPVVTDGPFTEAKEYLAGYYMVDCADVERATEIAGRISEARYCPVEVRRFIDEDRMSHGPDT
ncbi:MAG TPA: YciI family protein [Streptosporangiaceae bacterium]